MKLYRHLATIALIASAAAPILACSPAAKPAASANPDLSGFWELHDDSKHVPDAPLSEAGRAAADAGGKAAQFVQGGRLTTASRWCHPLGTPFIMGDSAPLDIVQGARETAIMAEVQSGARHIYTDGRGHPPLEAFDNTTNGHSTGRWENGAFVVETVGFNDRGNAAVPGGGRRGPNSKLVETYKLLDEGKQLSVTFTWTDPQYTKPHTYDFTYYKAPPETYAMEYFCDASDPARTENTLPQ